jgi:hypothetical protein
VRRLRLDLFVALQDGWRRPFRPGDQLELWTQDAECLGVLSAEVIHAMVDILLALGEIRALSPPPVTRHPLARVVPPPALPLSVEWRAKRRAERQSKKRR